MTAVQEPRIPQAPQALPTLGRRQHPVGLYAALAVTAFFIVALIAPQALATHDPFALALGDALQQPGFAHWFGTDEQGRDLYSRVVFGARESLLIGVGATAVSMTLALILGSAASLGGRVIGAIAARVIEIQFAFPTLLFALLLVSIVGPSAVSQVFAVAIGTAPGYARMIRAQILTAKTSGYVEAATALGHSRGRILARHIIPNAVRPLVAVIAMSIGQSIVWASSLSFLGLGVAPPSPEWGALLEAGRLYITHAPWLTVVPGLVIVVLAISATTIGQHIQRALERGEK